MTIVVTTQPDPLLTSADPIVRQSLALDGTDKDALVDVLLMAAQADLDGPLVGISVAQQSVTYTSSSFDCPPLRLPGGPIIGDVVLTYLDGDGAEQTLDADGYLVAGDGTVSLASGSTWPTIYDQGKAITATYNVGIEDDDDPRIQLMKIAITMHAKMTLDFDDPDTRRKVIESILRTLWVPVL